MNHAHQHDNHQEHDDHSHHSPEHFKRLFWINLILTLPVVYFAEHFQAWFGYQAVSFPGSQWVSPVLSTIIYFYGGKIFLAGAFQELKEKQPGMMTLIGLAISVAFFYSLAVTLGFPGKPFYWELATLIVIMLLGHWLEMASVQRASKALEDLAKLVPSQAHRLKDNGDTEDVSVDALKTGDQILIRPGEQVPADGEVVDGNSTMNEAFLTGESKPVSKSPGDEVVSGAVNQDGALKVRITRTGDETTINQMMRMVKEAQESRSGYQVLADKAAFWLTIIAITVGTLTFAAWLFLGQAVVFAITRSVTVLVITCPHALGLAVPLVIVSATALAANNGILVRNREAFERARNITVVAFDKTGTLTEGTFKVQRVATDGIEEDQALRVAASLEASSEHSLGLAIVEQASEQGMQWPEVKNFEVISGKGVKGDVDGKPYWVGSSNWMQEQGRTLGDDLKAYLNEAEEQGQSVIALADADKVLALFALADQIRESSKKAIQILHENHIRVVMITGDAEGVAKSVAGQLKIDEYFARVLPDQKSEKIKALKSEGAVSFVGDGINDAPALLEADLGIAIGAGTNVALESADLILAKSDPLDVSKIFVLAEKTYGKMIQNLWLAAGYNIVAIPLAAGVAYAWGILLSPAMGALLMSLSTVVVTINAMLLRRVKLT